MTQVRRRDIVSERTRIAVRDLMSDTVLREIDEMWQDELFAPPEVDPESVGGMRVTRFQGYLHQVDWTDPGHVTRALRVFEVALHPVFNPAPEWEQTPYITKAKARVQRLFQADGYELTDRGKIIARRTELVSPELLSNLTDPAVIHGHLERIASAIERNDPEQAIGSAKELIESTAKLVLRETGTEFPEKADVPDLVRRAQESLMIHPASRNGGPDGTGAVRKILGAASTIATGVAELRNTYGTGHGQDQKRTGLSSRHARLAINSAQLWCEFMLDTLADPAAPWRLADQTLGEQGDLDEPVSK